MDAKDGQMDQDIKEIGKKTKHKDLENYIMLMEIFIREIGNQIKHMARGLIFIQMEQGILDNGIKINKMEKEYKHGLMELAMSK